MKEELENALLKSLETVQEWAGKTMDFAAEQTPLVIQEVLNYNFVLAMTLFIVGILGLIVKPVVLFKFILPKFRKSIEEAGDRSQCSMGLEFGRGAIIFIFIMACIPFFTMTVKNFEIWLKIYLAPRVYIIEYLVELKDKF